LWRALRQRSIGSNHAVPGHARIFAGGHHRAGEAGRAGTQVAIGGDEPRWHRTGAPQHVAGAWRAAQRLSSSHTSAAAKPIWPNARAVPKFAAPSAAAIALTTAKAPNRKIMSPAVQGTAEGPARAALIRKWTMRG
jgi:hypothetical protein